MVAAGLAAAYSQPKFESLRTPPEVKNCLLHVKCLLIQLIFLANGRNMLFCILSVFQVTTLRSLPCITSLLFVM